MQHTTTSQRFATDRVSKLDGHRSVNHTVVVRLIEVMHKSSMYKPLEGKCQCGDVQYRVTGTPITVFACHCTECQRQSSSAFGMALWVRNAEVEMMSGEMRHWIRTMPSGKKMQCSFCPTCGTRLLHTVLGQSEVISIKPGTLNDTAWLKPAGHIWKKSAQPWIFENLTGLLYDENPESFADLISAWTEFNHA